MTDARSPLIKTPEGKWRRPTSYLRTIETGSVKTCQLDLWDKYGFVGYPITTYGTSFYQGAVNAGGNYYVAPVGMPSSVESNLVIKTRNKLKNMHVNLAQAFAEREQTTRLVGSNLVRLAQIVRNVYGAKKHFNKRYWRYLRNKWKKEDFFNYWLEIQYGWKPLVSDCYGAVAALKKREEEAGRGLVTVKSGHRYNEEEIIGRGGAVGASQYTFERVRKIEHRAYMRLDFLQSNSAPIGTLTQLGITNPLELAWELLPWSFVADWFVPVGDYLSSLDATRGWDFQGGSLSSKSTVEVRARNAKMVPEAAKPYRTSAVSVSGQGRQMRFERKAYTTAPLPARPSLEKLNKSSHEHVANGIALLMGLITGGGRVR
jgi:hypothetical protein